MQAIQTMNVCMSMYKQGQPLLNFPRGLKTTPLDFDHNQRQKIVVVMGATGTGKSRLSIELATRFSGEIVNSDKIQVYKGLNIVSNKVTKEECRGIPHHLLGIIDPDVDFTATDFRHQALTSIQSINAKDKLPIIVGGSNSYIESLVNGDPYFTSMYECCFLWIDVSLPILKLVVSKRVDEMVKSGLVDEVRRVYDPKADYKHGIRRAIGVPELDQFLRAERGVNPNSTLQVLLQEAIDEIKDNTYKLACRQLQKIYCLRDFWGWDLHHIDATKAYLKHGQEANEEWERLVGGPSIRIVRRFLCTNVGTNSTQPRRSVIQRHVTPMELVAATATH